MSGKSPAVAAAILLLQLNHIWKNNAAAAAVVQLQQQYLYKSIQNIKLLMYTRFSDDKWIHINNSSIGSCSCNCSCSSSNAATGLQLQQQYPFESTQDVKQSLCTKFGDDKSIISQIIQYNNFFSLIFEKIVQLQLQYCSCSSSTFINQFKISNYVYIPGLVIINEFISTILQFAAAAATAAAAGVMRLQGCSCSSSIL